MTTPMLAPVRRPPHDPLSFLLDARTGWPVLASTAAAIVDGSVRLARDPASQRRLTEANGSFGGLRQPANLACTDDGAIWLLDPATGRLLRFDRCACAFVPRRIVGSAVSGAIAGCGDRLFLTDGDWLKVLTVPTTALSAKWRPPMPWQPAGVLVDRHRQVRVADPLNGLLHTFSWTGRYLGAVAGIGAATNLAEALDGTIYAADTVSAYRIDGAVVTAGDAASDELADRFAPVPFTADERNYLQLGGLCVPPGNCTFDLAGNPVQPPAAAVKNPYLLDGSVLLGPLDSQLDGCTWHRVILHGSIPPGGSVQVRTYTAHAALPLSDITGLADSAWQTRSTAQGGVRDGWDCLITSDPGRYLWLRLDLTGSGADTATISALEVEYPRITLRRYLPAVYGADQDSAAFTDRFLALFDRNLRDVELLVDGLPGVLDAEATPFLDWLSSWVGLTVDSRLPEPIRRRLLARSARLYDLRGTYAGLRELLIIVLGLDVRPSCPTCAREPGSCRPARAACPPRPPAMSSWEPPPLVLEHFRLRRWLRLGAGAIGSESMLWGRRIVNRSQLGNGAQVGGTQLKATQDPLRDPFHVYAHRYTVFVPAAVGSTPQQRRIMQRLLDFAAPAHTAGSIDYVEPRFRIGVQSSLGLDSVVARVPTGLVLGETPLGQATVLTGTAVGAGAPRNLGTTTVLT